MGNQIIKQPDGRFAIFSSESDTIVEWDATEAYYQFAVTWDEALETDRDHGGEVWREFQS